MNEDDRTKEALFRHAILGDLQRSAKMTRFRSFELTQAGGRI